MYAIRSYYGPCIDHKIFHDLHAEMSGGLKAKRRDPVGEVEIVIDGFRYMDDLDGSYNFV